MPNKEYGRFYALPIPPEDYSENLVRLNMLMMRQLQDEMKNVAGQFSNYCAILVPGSDGRLETGSPLSRTELITLFNDNIDPQEQHRIQSALEGILTKDFKLDNLEFKSPSSNLAYFRDNEKNVQLARIADSQVVLGEQEQLKDAKERLEKDIINLHGDKMDIANSTVRSARKVVETGKNRIGGEDRIHFDLTTNQIVYDPRSFQLSFKVGPLRLVQTKLILETAKKIRRDKKTGLIPDLPTPITHRLDYLEGNNMTTLNKESLSEISEIYSFFLKQYHASEETYRLEGNPIRHIDEELKREIARKLIRLQQLMQAFTLK